jgi:hypothetical protein
MTRTYSTPSTDALHSVIVAVTSLVVVVFAACLLNTFSSA